MALNPPAGRRPARHAKTTPTRALTGTEGLGTLPDDLDEFLVLIRRWSSTG